MRQKPRMREGDEAPGFELPASDGTTVSLGSFRGSKNVVLCFYPKNHLFGCPSKKVFKMAEGVIGSYPDIVSADSVLFAVSIDTVGDQAKFVKEYGIPYLHLSDVRKAVCKKYAGLNFVGLAKRTTFVIDRRGIIKKIYRDINVERHGKEITDLLRQLKDGN